MNAQQAKNLTVGTLVHFTGQEDHPNFGEVVKIEFPYIYIEWGADDTSKHHILEMSKIEVSAPY